MWFCLLFFAATFVVPSAAGACSEQGLLLLNCLDKLADLAGTQRPSRHPDFLGNPGVVCDAMLAEFSTKADAMFDLCGPWYPAIASSAQRAARVPKPKSSGPSGRAFLPQAQASCPSSPAVVQYPADDNSTSPAYHSLLGAMMHGGNGLSAYKKSDGTTVDFKVFLNDHTQRADHEAVARLLIAISIFNLPVRCDTTVSSVLSGEWCNLLRSSNAMALGALERLYAAIEFHNRLIDEAELATALQNTQDIRTDICAQTTALTDAVSASTESVTSSLNAVVTSFNATLQNQTVALSTSLANEVSDIKGSLANSTDKILESIASHAINVNLSDVVAGINNKTSQQIAGANDALAASTAALNETITDAAAALEAMLSDAINEAMETVLMNATARILALEEHLTVLHKLLLTPAGARPGYAMTNCMCGDGECNGVCKAQV